MPDLRPLLRLAALLSLLSVAGCGYKGALYLPEEAPQNDNSQAEPQPSTDDSGDSD